MESDSAQVRRRMGLIAAVAISMSALFAGSGVSAADPYDGDDGGGDSSYSSGGDDGGSVPEAPSGGSVPEAPSGGGMEEPSGGALDEPGGTEAPTGGIPDEPGGAETPGTATDVEPGGGTPAEPGNDGPAGGGATPAPDSGGGATATPEPGEEATEPSGPQASQEDVTTAMASEVETITSTEVSSQELTSYQESISSTVTTSSLTTGLALSSPVTLWNSSWISYDSYYRPVFTNPYRTPLSVLYDYGGSTQVLTVAPLARATLNVPDAGVYSFTAMTRPASGPATNLSVGSFSGGGYQPAPGQAPPQRPASLNTQKNALVQVRFDRGSSAPFRVKTLTDLGADPAVNGATKVLLDEEVPAWGQWSKTDKGEAVFVISQTQTLPGVNPPAQEPLPGYNVKLTAAEKPSWVEKNKTALIVVAVGAGVLALAAVGFMLVSRRRGAGG
ncbi:hypothetical protein [Mycobacterium sp. shizuoka-1]|uniref:hypothetical protein n=1 Tax=Mycobacterium sp. shizuoka-1 TaxID=2039281 RepID=UPI0011590F8B|nr:hypothetical protein [Mycobacterium sp. shizuoka-1]